MRSVQRSLRLDSDLDEFVKTLPPGTTNSLVNQLIRLFKDNKSIQDMVSVKDARFANFKPVDLPTIILNPAAVSPQVEKSVDKPDSLLDEIVPN